MPLIDRLLQIAYYALLAVVPVWFVVLGVGLLIDPAGTDETVAGVLFVALVVIPFGVWAVIRRPRRGTRSP